MFMDYSYLFVNNEKVRCIRYLRARLKKKHMKYKYDEP